MRWLLVLLGTLTLVAGCAEQASAPPAASPPTGAPPVVVAFGTPVRLPDGIDVLVEAPHVHAPARDRAGSVPDQLLQLRVIVTDGTPAAYPVGRTSVALTFDGQAAGAPIPLDEPPEVIAPGPSTLLPGQTGRFDLLFPVPATGTDVVAAVTDQAGSTPVFVRGPSPAPPSTTTTPPSSTTTSSRAPTTTRSSSSVDSSAGCGPRAAARGVFNPGCPEYQGYLDPGRAAGRGPTSGDIQHADGCEKGYIPASEC